MPDKKYPNKDLEASLKKAFVDKRFESILMDGRECQNQFLVDGVNYGFKKGWLGVDGEIDESQYTAVTYKLTKKGKKHFGMN